jgi:hypothetical protein
MPGLLVKDTVCSFTLDRLYLSFRKWLSRTIMDLVDVMAGLSFNYSCCLYSEWW